MLKEADLSARALGVQLQVVEARGPADFDRAFSEISAKGAGALVVLTTPAFDIERQRIVDLAAKNRLPTVYATRNYVDGGGLMSYGPNFADLHRRAATYVDKILKGAKPVRPSRRAADQVRTGHQSARPRRRSASPCRPHCLPEPTM